MFKKVLALIALGLYASNAAAYLNTVDASAYALGTYASAAAKPLMVNPNTVYTINTGADTTKIDYSLVVKCPQPKTCRPIKKRFLFYISSYNGYDDGGVEVFEAGGSTTALATTYSAMGDPGYGSLLTLFCDNGTLTVDYS